MLIAMSLPTNREKRSQCCQGPMPPAGALPPPPGMMPRPHQPSPGAALQMQQQLPGPPPLAPPGALHQQNGGEASHMADPSPGSSSICDGLVKRSIPENSDRNGWTVRFTRGLRVHSLRWLRWQTCCQRIRCVWSYTLEFCMQRLGHSSSSLRHSNISCRDRRRAMHRPASACRPRRKPASKRACSPILPARTSTSGSRCGEWLGSGLGSGSGPGPGPGPGPGSGLGFRGRFLTLRRLVAGASFHHSRPHGKACTMCAIGHVVEASV